MGPIQALFRVEILNWLMMGSLSCGIIEIPLCGSGFARTAPLVSVSGCLVVVAQCRGHPLLEFFEVTGLSQFLGDCLLQVIVLHRSFDYVKICIHQICFLF